MPRAEISDEKWLKLEPLLPPTHSDKPGHPFNPHRPVIEGILWDLRTGAPWRDLPPRFGPWQTCYDRFVRWRRSGLWDQILQTLQTEADSSGSLDWNTTAVDGSIVKAHQHAAGARHTPAKAEPTKTKPDTGTKVVVEPRPVAPNDPTPVQQEQVRDSETPPPPPATTTVVASAPVASASAPATVSEEALGRSRGGISTKIHLLCDGKGRPLSIHLSGGQVNDCQELETVLDGVCVPKEGRGRPRTRPKRVVGDKGYSQRKSRAALRKRGIGSMIPERRDQRANRIKRGQTGGRPVRFDNVEYKRRNVVERCFNRLKQWRRVATRYEKRGLNYLAMVKLAAIMIWL